MTDLFVFRNTTVEPLFGSEGVRCSGYGDISDLGEEAAACVWAYTLPVGCDIGAQIREADSYIDRLRLVLDRIGPARMCYLFTLACPYVLPVESGSGALRAAVARYDAALYAFAAARPNVRVLDFASFLGRYACGERIDWRHWFLARTAVSPRLQSDFRHWFAAERRAALMQRRKCLVLDLDNTLWGGVLGEEGPEGIRIGGDYPGNAYLLFQQGIRELARTGVILAVCSKNNEADVLEVWERNPELVLRRGDFAARRINWRDKAGNIRELAAELNIGLDSMVFVDDNPAERELVRRMVPEVAVPDFPEQPYRLPEFLRDMADRYFRIYALTAEDRAKTEQYRANAARAEAARGYADFGDYLRSLGMVLTIRRADDFTRPRVAQMTQKTNQFNLTTRRYSEADIRRIEDSGGPGLHAFGARPLRRQRHHGVPDRGRRRDRHPVAELPHPGPGHRAGLPAHGACPPAPRRGCDALGLLPPDGEERADGPLLRPGGFHSRGARCRRQRALYVGSDCGGYRGRCLLHD